METLPEEILYKIYKYKHQLEFCDVVDEIELYIYKYCDTCGQGLVFGKRRCNCPREIRDDISVVSDVVSDTDYSDVSDYESDDFWMYEF